MWDWCTGILEQKQSPGEHKNGDGPAGCSTHKTSLHMCVRLRLPATYREVLLSHTIKSFWLLVSSYHPYCAGCSGTAVLARSMQGGCVVEQALTADSGREEAGGLW